MIDSHSDLEAKKKAKKEAKKKAVICSGCLDNPLHKYKNKFSPRCIDKKCQLCCTNISCNTMSHRTKHRNAKVDC